MKLRRVFLWVTRSRHDPTLVEAEGEADDEVSMTAFSEDEGGCWLWPSPVLTDASRLQLRFLRLAPRVESAWLRAIESR